jgi:beta-lactamase regulating signal transducer with metallopeptidase domain
MNVSLGSWLTEVPWAGIAGLVLDISVKAVFICAMAWLAALAMRPVSANARSTVWVFTLAVLLVLPLAQLVPPVWNLPVIPEVGSWFGRDVSTEGLVIPGDKAIDALGGAQITALDPAAPALVSARLVEGWYAWATLAWLAGAVLALCWLAVRLALGRRILARCEEAGREWVELLEESAAKLGLKKSIRLFESSEIGAAVTVGAINPAIVVPAGSAEWPSEKRRYILSHELAHIKRRDGLVEVLATVVKSVHWFNPFVWYAVRAARIERERDCDDAVLSTGAKPSDYAMLLMDIAAGLGERRGSAWQLSTISQGSNLKERIMCILDPKIDRNRGRRRAGIVSCIVIAAIVLPLSMSGVWRTQAQAQEKTDKAKKTEELKKKEMTLKEKELQLQKKMESMSAEEREQFKKELELKKKMAGMSAEEKTKLSWEKISKNKDSAAVCIHDAIEKEGLKAGLHLAQELDQSGDQKCYFKEPEFNTLGYLYLHRGALKEAVAVFDMNVRRYPDSWNVYDSLGEAYLAAGKYEKARELYKKSLALNPENENGKNMLAKIEEQETNGGKVSTASEK